MKLRPLSIVLAALGGLLLFGAVLAFSWYVYYPLLENQCGRSCGRTLSASLEPGYAATSILERCLCQTPAGPVMGHFFATNETLDWLIQVLIRISSIGLILLIILFPLGKLIQKIEQR